MICPGACLHFQGGAEGDSPEEQGQGWRALLVGVCHQVNTQLKDALDSSQQLLGKHDQVLFMRLDVITLALS